jgi:hypothetical protein
VEWAERREWSERVSKGVRVGWIGVEGTGEGEEAVEGEGEGKREGERPGD